MVDENRKAPCKIKGCRGPEGKSTDLIFTGRNIPLEAKLSLTLSSFTAYDPKHEMLAALFGPSLANPFAVAAPIHRSIRSSNGTTLSFS